MAIQPIADRVLIEPISKESISAGGIIIPDQAKGKSNIGIIRGVGESKMYEDDIPLAVGDKVLFEENAGIEIEENGVKMRLCKRGNVILKYN